MTTTADITYRNMPHSEWLDREIQKRVARLAEFCPDIVSCKVLVGRPHRRHEHGNRFDVRIDMAVPGEKIVAGHLSSLHALVAFRRACAAAKRQLTEYVRRRRREVKTHRNTRRAAASA